MKKKLSNWSISNELYKLIKLILQKEDTILELGSGEGTKRLLLDFNVISIEHDKEWLNYVKNGKYIFAPIKNYGNYNWYDDSFINQIPTNYNLLLIDGPPGRIGRYGLIHHIDKFYNGSPMILDDTQRPEELKLAKELAKKYNKEISEYKSEKKNFILLSN